MSGYRQTDIYAVRQGGEGGTHCTADKTGNQRNISHPAVIRRDWSLRQVARTYNYAGRQVN